MDIVDRKTRSRMMAGIRGSNTQPEKWIRSQLHRRGFRFRLHVVDLPGKPDIVLPRYRSVIMVHGCFWHGHGCHLFKWPATRPAFWRKKIKDTCQRDVNTIRLLKKAGWRVAVAWECEIREQGDLIDMLCNWLLEGKQPVF